MLADYFSDVVRYNDYGLRLHFFDLKGPIAQRSNDTIEDTETTADALEALFGPEVTSVVLEVTDDKPLEKQVRKQLQIDHVPHISLEAKLVKLADKICNLRDILSSPPVDWPVERKQDYFNWAAQVVDGIRGIHPRLESVFDGLLARQAELFRFLTAIHKRT